MHSGIVVRPLPSRQGRSTLCQLTVRILRLRNILRKTTSKSYLVRIQQPNHGMCTGKSQPLSRVPHQRATSKSLGAGASQGFRPTHVSHRAQACFP